MRALALVVLLQLTTLSLYSQSALSPTDSLFIVIYTMGPSWDGARKPSEQLYFKEHSENLVAWRKEGIIRFGARYEAKGMIIIGATSLVAARELIERDLGVSSKLFKAEVQKLSPFHFGCIEKPK